MQLDVPHSLLLSLSLYTICTRHAYHSQKSILLSPVVQALNQPRWILRVLLSLRFLYDLAKVTWPFSI